MRPQLIKNPFYLLIVLIVVIVVIAATAILIHQYILWGKWFEIGDIHHETLFLILIAFIIGMVVSPIILMKAKQRRQHH